MWLLFALLILTAGRGPCDDPFFEDAWVCKTIRYDSCARTTCVIPGTTCRTVIWEMYVTPGGNSRGGGAIPDKPRVVPTWTMVKALYK